MIVGGIALLRLSDLIMGLAGASAGALSGVVVFAWGYPMLALLAALTTAPLVVLTYRFVRPAVIRLQPEEL